MPSSARPAPEPPVPGSPAAKPPVPGSPAPEPPVLGAPAPEPGGAAGDPAVAAWRRWTAGEPRWHSASVVLLAIALQLLLPASLRPAPGWLLPALEVLLLAILVAANPGRMDRRHPGLRYGSIAVIGLLSISNAVSAALLVGDLIRGAAVTASAGRLLASGGAVYVTNVIAFALWYWEMDRGGPVARAYGDRPHPDLMFPQMASPDLAPPEWEPLLADYLYVSFTNATAFSPTDTLPLTRAAKSLMALQSAVALVTAALVIARAVNILR